MKKASLYIFILIALVNIIGNFFANPYLIDFSKPLLMPLLIIYFVVSWAIPRNKLFYFTIAALLFSWAGDVLLMFQGKDSSFFIFGLSAFLLAHVSYMFSYHYAQTDLGIVQNKKFVVLRVFVLAMIGGAILNVLWPHLGSLKIPVISYTIVIILMAVFAVLRKDRTSPSSFSYTYGGALFFIVSDGMIAITKFIEPFEHYRVFIMLTYLVAQFLIIKGILAHPTNK